MAHIFDFFFFCAFRSPGDIWRPRGPPEKFPPRVRTSDRRTDWKLKDRPTRELK